MNFPTTLNVFFKLIFKTFPVWLISLFVISVLYRSATNISWSFVNKWIVEMFESATTGVFSWVFWTVVGCFLFGWGALNSLARRVAPAAGKP